jgi:hypothetical protein
VKPDPFEQMKRDSDRDWEITQEFFHIRTANDVVGKMVYRATMGLSRNGDAPKELGGEEWWYHLGKLIRNAERRGEQLRPRTLEEKYRK